MEGADVHAYPEIVEREADEEYGVGNHSYDHATCLSLDDEQAWRQIRGTTEELEILLRLSGVNLDFDRDADFLSHRRPKVQQPLGGSFDRDYERVASAALAVVAITGFLPPAAHRKNRN